MSESTAVELVADAHAIVGEGPVWDASTGLLVWVDIEGKRIHEFDPDTGVDREIEVPQYPGAVVRRASGGYMAAVTNGFASVDRDGRFELVVPVEADLSENRMNDGKCDPQGRFWAGTTRMTHDAPIGVLHRLDADLSLHPMVDELWVSNGLDWTFDERHMYFIDSFAGSVDLFDFDAATGDIANRRPLIDVPESWGTPDGMTLDAEGYLWVAFWGSSRVRRFDPEGRLDREITLPVTQVTSCAFGGPDLRDLYITSGARGLDAEALEREPHAGGLFRARPGVQGRPAFEFRG
ncbi:MAG: SMP-30/gluconolactonase/LRE family protein [Chloroflexota bacterium]|nr:SMP-30/gluconolactonase/LRE family protein [Chloroflexota bacterium]